MQADPASLLPSVVSPAEQGRSLRRAAYLTAGMGAAYSILFFLSYWLVSTTPGVRASDADIQKFYTSGDVRRLTVVGLYLMPFAGIAFLWFIVALRMWIAHSTQKISALLSNIQLVSGIIFITLFFAAGASQSVVAASVEFSDAPVDPIIARQFPQFGNALIFVFAIRMAAMFIFATSNIGRASGIMPRWFVYAGFIVGLFLLLSATFSPFLVLVFPVWVLGVCVLLFLRARRIPADAVIGEKPEIRSQRSEASS